MEFISFCKTLLRSVHSLKMQIMAVTLLCACLELSAEEKPNEIYIVTDQWRSTAFGYADNQVLKTPNIDKFSKRAVIFKNPVSVWPICPPYRAALMTVRFPTLTEIFMNDHYLPERELCMAEIFNAAGYTTAHYGKWHLDGHGRFKNVQPFWRYKVFKKKNRVSPGNTTYFIDPANGDDENSGLKKDNSWRTFIHLNQLKLSPGDRVEIVSPSALDQTLMLTGEGAIDNPVEVHFAKGRYDLLPDNLYRQKYNISNTNDSPDSLKAVGILLRHAKNFQISGEGAGIICRGKMIEVCIDSCENISIADLHFDYKRPTVSEFKIVDSGDGFADIKIHQDSKYKIENEHIKWIGEGWSYETGLAQELNLQTNEVKRIPDPLKGLKIKELSPYLVRATGNNNMKIGRIYQLRNTFRDYAAVFTRRSKNITWENVNFYFMHGMGIVCQFSDNLTFDSVSVAPDSSSGRTASAWADCLHISDCRGKVLVKDCIFSGAQDDAINIHGTYLGVVKKISDKKLIVRFMHKQTYGFLAFNPGDEIDFVNRETYASYGLNKVKDAILLNPKEILITLMESAPPKLKLKDVIENVTWTPEVEIRGCTVSRIPTRGFLLSTRRKVLVEENKFFATHMSAILMAIDASNWYESGYVRDMIIRNNKFILCGEPVILIEPGNRLANDSVDQNIRIENNGFVLRDQIMVKAKSTKNLRVTGNTIVAKEKLDDEIAIKTSDCYEVNIDRNNYKIER